MPAEVAIWHWMATNGLAILMAVYFATLACTILLAVATYKLAIKIRAVARESEQQRKFLDGLPNQIGELATRMSMWETPAVAAHKQSNERDIPTHLPEIRNEIAALQAELESD